jgi:hypothetical protein
MRETGSRMGLISVAGAWQGGLLTGWCWDGQWWWLGFGWMFANVLLDWNLPVRAARTATEQ